MSLHQLAQKALDEATPTDGIVAISQGTFDQMLRALAVSRDSIKALLSQMKREGCSMTSANVFVAESLVKDAVPRG